MNYQKDTSEKNIINNLTIALNVLYIKNGCMSSQRCKT